MSPAFWIRFLPERKIKSNVHQHLLLIVVTVITIGFTVMWIQLPTTPLAIVTPVSVLKPRALQAPSRLLPYKYWEHRRIYSENYIQITCSNFPRFEEIQFAAASWQHLQVENGNVYVYAAYWDDRFEDPLVRVLIYCDVMPLPKLVCQFWYEDENAPIAEPSTVTYGWQPQWGGPTDRINEPYILACRARRHPPEKQRAPAAVSVVREDNLCGTPTNVLNVQGAPQPDSPLPTFNASAISVCLKWMQFRDDLSSRLVEWIEFIKTFGASKLFVFEVQSHPNTRRVLDYYVSTGFADVTEFAHAPQLRSNFSPGAQNFHDYRRELLTLNDCLYRSMHKYPWMTAIDTDEIIVPRRRNNWQQIIAEETQGIKGLDAIAFSNYYFLDPVQLDLAAPSYLTILGHMWRAREPNPPGHNVKSFHNTSSVVAMHNHYPMSCGSRNCWNHNVNDTVARLHHYRSRCGDDTLDCPAMRDTVRDDIITKWKYVMKEVDRVLTMLGLNPKL